jgi:hypothetical protein
LDPNREYISAYHHAKCWAGEQRPKKVEVEYNPLNLNVNNLLEHDLYIVSIYEDDKLLDSSLIYGPRPLRSQKEGYFINFLRA